MPPGSRSGNLAAARKVPPGEDLVAAPRQQEPEPQGSRPGGTAMRGKGNTTNAFGADNAGFLAWNISKRASSALSNAADARQMVDTARQRNAGDLGAMETLLAEIEDAAASAGRTWDRIRAVADDQDPDLIEPTESGVSIIQNRGSNAALHKTISAIWRDDDSAERVRLLFDQLRLLAEET